MQSMTWEKFYCLVWKLNYKYWPDYFTYYYLLISLDDAAITARDVILSLFFYYFYFLTGLSYYSSRFFGFTYLDS